jgi:hypothetical protein
VSDPLTAALEGSDPLSLFAAQEEASDPFVDTAPSVSFIHASHFTSPLLFVSWEI